MFCVQCEHTIRTPVATGCSYAMGMCGKTSEVSDLQDVLIYLLQGVSAYALKARTFGIIDRAIDAYVVASWRIRKGVSVRWVIAATVVRISSPRFAGSCSAESVASRSALTRIDGPARS